MLIEEVVIKTVTGFTPHSEKQELALFSKKKKIVLATGIQFGKTTVGAVFIRRLMHEFSDPIDNFIITAPSYKILKQSSLPAFLNVMGGLGKYSGQDACYYIKNGPTVYCRTATHPDSVVGITNVRGIWGDEAGKYPLYFWENLQARSAFKDCPIILTTSPYSLNWLYKEIIRPYMKGIIDPDVEVIQAASIENPYFPRSSYNRQKKTMDPRRFSMLYGGDFSKFEGLVYNCFDEDLNECEKFDHGPRRFYIGGVDWGFTDPFVIKIRSVSPSGEMVDVSEFYKPGLRSSEVIEAIVLKNKIFKPVSFECDPSRPDYIAQLVDLGVPAVAAHNDILEGIDAHYEYIKTLKYKVLKGTCPYTKDEIEMYHYPETKDLKVDQNKDKKIELPVDQHNHAMDVDRYISVKLKRDGIGITFDPKTPDEEEKTALTQAERLAKLKRLSA